MRPTTDNPNTQMSWYIGSGQNWPENGPCAPRTDKDDGPFAAEVPLQRIIFFCDTVWKKVGTGRLREDLRKLKNSKIPTGKAGWELDFQLSPGGILLHEMTHQILKTGNLPLGSTEACMLMGPSSR